MNAAIEKLKKIEARASELAYQRDTNETKWLKAIAAAKASPEWEAYRKQTGIAPDYNYGDLLA